MTPVITTETLYLSSVLPEHTDRKQKRAKRSRKGTDRGENDKCGAEEEGEKGGEARGR